MLNFRSKTSKREIPPRIRSEGEKVREETHKNLEREKIHADTHHHLSDAREEMDTDLALRQINHRDTQIPWETLEEARKPGVRFAELQNKPFWRRLGLYTKLMKGSNDSYGAHFHAEKLGKLSDYQKADVVEQIENQDQKGMKWSTKLASTLMKTHAEYELFLKGYVRKEKSDGAATDVYPVKHNETLPEIMGARGAQKQWQEIQDGDVVGPLDWDKPLPQGTYVYFNAGGYPVYISSREHERRTVPIFVRRKDLMEEKPPTNWKWGSEAHKRYRFLESRLQVGDILFSNALRFLRSGPKRLFFAMGRMVQGMSEEDENFPYVHPMVVTGRDANGRVKIAHLVGGTQSHVRTLEQLVNEDAIDSFSVARISEPSKAREFAKSALETATGTKYDPILKVKKYADALAKIHAGKTLSKKEDTLLKTVCVCTKVVNDAGKKTGISELQNTTTALSMFQNLTIVDSMNIQRGAKQPNAGIAPAKIGQENAKRAA